MNIERKCEKERVLFKCVGWSSEQQILPPPLFFLDIFLARSKDGCQNFTTFLLGCF